jgi:hypothetical protein
MKLFASKSFMINFKDYKDSGLRSGFKASNDLESNSSPSTVAALSRTIDLIQASYSPGLFYFLS